MYRNYFYLNRAVVELNDLLPGRRIRNIFSQEKDKLIIECALGFEERFFLEICVNPGNPFITVKDDFRRAKKNVTDLFPEAIEADLLSAEISTADRILKITTSKGEFFFLIRGKFTNFILQQSENFIFFKHSTDVIPAELLKELESHEYTSAFNLPSINLNDDSEFSSQIRKEYPFISKEIIMEVKTRIMDPDKESFTASLNKVILEVITERAAVCVDKNTKEIHLYPESFHIYQCENKVLFDSFFKALNTFISKKFQIEGLEEKEKIIARVIDRELYKITGKLNKLKTRIETGSRDEYYSKLGNLLLINRHRLSKGMPDIEVEDIYAENEKILIKLDPSLSPQKNIDGYFDKAKNEKINFEKSVQLYHNSEKQFERFRLIKEKFDNYKEPDELLSIMKELKIKDFVPKPEKEDLKGKFKQYIIEKNYYLYVGRDSKNNDLLTTKFARQNDYWFHARSVSGSHVVLKNDSGKDVPKSVLKKAASLAAYHSKAKTAGLVPVSYTFKKYVVKKKGMEAGKVALLREDVLLVRPEIPEGTEFISNE